MARLRELMNRPDLPDVEIEEISCDSRSLGKGALFAALPGVRSNGCEFIPAALRNGAIAALVPEGTERPEGCADLIWIDRKSVV